MDYNKLKYEVEQGKSISKLATLFCTSKTNIRYWLKKYNLSTIRNPIFYSDKKICPCCKLEKNISEFYNRRKKVGNSVYCKLCSKEQTVLRQRNLKQICVEYKGGKCIICGYNRCNAALKFHHLNPNEKEFNLSHHKLTSFNEKIKQELDKCILVCGNCHDEIHVGLVKWCSG